MAWGPGQPLVVEEILVDPPQKMEVRIKIHFTSVCHTDLGAWQGKVLIDHPFITHSIYIKARTSKFHIYTIELSLILDFDLYAE